MYINTVMQHADEDDLATKIKEKKEAGFDLSED